VADNFSMLTVETLAHPLIYLFSHAPQDETRRNEPAGRLHPGMPHRMKSIKNRTTHGTGTRGRNTPVETSPKIRLSAAGTVVTTKEEEVRRRPTRDRFVVNAPFPQNQSPAGEAPHCKLSKRPRLPAATKGGRERPPQHWTYQVDNEDLQLIQL
jgi:hypothetical protein